MNTQKRKVRKYRLVTPDVISKFKADKLAYGNGTAAVADGHESGEYDSRLAISSRAFKIEKKSKESNTVQYIDDTLQQIGIDAINRIGNMVNSPDEQVATRNAQYVVDHIRGQATKKSINLNATVNVQDVLA